MAEITAASVKELRERSGAGMMDCKKALTENEGEMEAAVDWLRAKGLAAAAKKAGRTAGEGLVGVAVTGTKGAVVEVNSETDFVAKNEQFQGFVREVAKLALTTGDDVDALNDAAYPTGGTVAEALTNNIATIGENQSLRRASLLEVGEGAVVSYVHNAAAPGLGKIGVLVALESSADAAVLQALGKQIAMHIAAAKAAGHELCVVVGGGNIFRGIAGAAKGFDRASADYMGMLATVMNALAVQNALEKLGVDTRVQSAIPMASVCEPYIRRRALRHIEKGRIVLFAAGTGNPYFTTDTAAALRAAEMSCDALFKGTSVDGVYDADPKKVAGATRYDHLGFNRVLGDDLKVMDAAAVALCRDNNIPIVVFNIRQPGNLAQVLAGGGVATIVQNEE